MKTLDEVITELYIWDTCDKYPESFYDDEVTRDALHYLKEYWETLNKKLYIPDGYKTIKLGDKNNEDVG